MMIESFASKIFSQFQYNNNVTYHLCKSIVGYPQAKQVS